MMAAVLFLASVATFAIEEWFRQTRRARPKEFVNGKVVKHYDKQLALWIASCLAVIAVSVFSWVAGVPVPAAFSIAVIVPLAVMAFRRLVANERPLLKIGDLFDSK